jgi:hypothetical protein
MSFIAVRIVTYNLDIITGIKVWAKPKSAFLAFGGNALCVSFSMAL